MRIRHKAFEVAAALAIVLAAPAQAWSNQGHMVTGAIAHDRLMEVQPALIATVETMMQQHPEWPKFAAELAPYSGVARSRRLFELMARWPDDARGGPYDRAASHYWVRILVSTANPIPVPDILRKAILGQGDEAYAVHYATLADFSAPPADRAMSLCWLMHLAGDIQQPLHAAQMASRQFPDADAAGSQAFVVTDTVPSMSLHMYWDNVVGGDDDNDPNVEAQRLRLEKLWPVGALPEYNGKAEPAAFRSWADESYRLAWDVAYDRSRFEGAPANMPPVPIPMPYQTNRDTLGGRRVALSGYRIADGLRLTLNYAAAVEAALAKQ